MRNVVRELIAERQPHSKYVVEQVNVWQLGIGEAKDCFHNACGMAKTDIDKRYVNGNLKLTHLPQKTVI